MSQIKSVKEVKIGINLGKDTTPVGRLAIRDRRIYFEYYRDFIDRGLEISPQCSHEDISPTACHSDLLNAATTNSEITFLFRIHRSDYHSFSYVK